MSDVKNGLLKVDLFHWKYFGDFVYQELMDYKSYVFRGQRCENWKLESTLDRADGAWRPKARQDHFEAFKYAVRGRRGPNPAKLESENDWWALGQHHGLNTPLLDWTTSPFVAAYFAFAGNKHDNTTRRVVWAISRASVERKSREIDAAHAAAGRTGRAPVIEFFTPLSDENARLVNQGGLFSRGPDRTTVETWVTTNFPDTDHFWRAIKITMPSAHRRAALKSLNRMNINHLTLFPDLYGASAFCNTALEIAGY